MEVIDAAVNSGVDIKTAAVAALIMLALGGAGGSVLSGGVSSDKHDALAETVARHDGRIERLEEQERLLTLTLSQVSQEQRYANEKLDRIERAITRMEEP